MSALASRRNLLDRAGKSNPLPEGTFAVGIGLLISGISAYLFQVVAARALGTDGFAPLAVMWAVTFVATPGFFLPVEQEVGRALAHRRSRGQGGAPVLLQAAKLGGGLAGLLIAVSLVASPVIVHSLFGDSWLLLVGFVLALAGYYLGHLGRGALSGTNRFGAYGLYMGAEGLLRVIGVVALALLGVDTVGPYGLAVGLPPALAIALAVRRHRPLTEPGPDAPWDELTSNLGWLLGGSVLAALLLNAGPIAVKVLATDAEHDLAGRFFACLVISRVPLFLFQAVQASLLPKLAALAGAGRLDEFHVGFRRLLGVVVGIGVLATVGALAVGPFAVRILFGADYDLGRRTLTMLALASALYMVALTLAQALIALHGHARVVAGWLAGVAGFVVLTAVGRDLLLRVEVGLVAGSAAALAVMAWQLQLRLAGGARPQPGDVLEALHEIPMEG